MNFAQFSVVTTYNHSDTAIQVKFRNNYPDKEVIVKNENHMYDGGSFCDVYFIGIKGDTLSWYRCNYVAKLKPNTLYVVIKPKQEENFIFNLNRIKNNTDLKYVKKIGVHVWVRRYIEDTKFIKEIDYNKEFELLFNNDH